MIEFMQSHFGFLWIPLLGGLGVALLAGPLGAVIVWRRLAYFGDTLAHSGLLGITLALALQINVIAGVCIIAITIACLLLKLQSHIKVASDTLLGLLSHTVLALGLLVLSLMQNLRVDVLGFLYGDILTITWRDVLTIYLGVAVVFFFMHRIWQRLLLLTVDPDLAKVEGVSIERITFTYTILLAIVVAVALKLVGVLLITALLVIPAATARSLAQSPESMAGLASLIGMLSVVGGMLISQYWDLPAGPAIVVVSACILLVVATLSKIKLYG